ncbi:unnamed protein product, partial [marine sediment metagenome]
LYIASKVYEKWRTKEPGVTVPEDIRVESLNDEQMRDLNQLKGFIYKKRTDIRLDRDRAGRREKKEEEAEQRKAERPALFDF